MLYHCRRSARNTQYTSARNNLSLSITHLSHSRQWLDAHKPQPASRRRGLKKVGGQKVAVLRRTLQIFDRIPTESWKHPVERSCRKFQFCLYISPKWGLLTPNFTFLENNFQTRKFSDDQKFRVGYDVTADRVRNLAHHGDLCDVYETLTETIWRIMWWHALSSSVLVDIRLGRGGTSTSSWQRFTTSQTASSSHSSIRHHSFHQLAY